MGNLMFCRENCYFILKQYDEKMKALYRLYAHQYAGTVFGQPALRLFKQFKQNELELFQLDEEHRISLIQSTHYEVERMRDPITGNSLPSTFGDMDEEQKKAYLRELIKKTYIILDLEDVFEGDNSSFYSKSVTKEMFSNQHSIMKSFVFDEENLCEGLRNFDSHVMRLLSDYVEFSEKIKASMSPENQFFLGRLTITLKAVFIKEAKSMSFEGIKCLIKDVIRILFDTIIIGYEIEMKSNQYEGQFGNFNFYSQTNIWTLISAIFFEDQHFYQAVQTRIKDLLHQQLRKYKQGGFYRKGEIIRMLKTGEGKKQVKIGGLWEKDTDQDFFEKCDRVLNRVSKYREPILKLKVMGEVERQIEKAYIKLSVEKPLDRDVMIIIARFLLNRSYSPEIILSIILAYLANHPRYLLTSKGSTLITFISEIETSFRIQLPENT